MPASPAPLTQLKDVQTSTLTNVLSYGPSGTGKTWFGGTAGPRTLFINIGNGIKTIQSPLFKKQYPGHDEMLVASINEPMDSHGYPLVADAFDIVTDTIDAALKTAGDRFDTIVIDDASALRRFALNKGLEINQKLGRSKSDEMSDKYEVQVIAVQDYAIEMNLIEQFVAGYSVIARENGKHLIVTAHERNVYKKGDKIGEAPMLYKIKPGFTGQTFPDSVTQYFDWVMHMESVAGGSQGTVYRARLAGDDVLTAKCRDAGVFGSVEVDPNFLRMMSKVNNLKKGV